MHFENNRGVINIRLKRILQTKIKLNKKSRSLMIRANRSSSTYYYNLNYI
ncbi:17399_t:CDS:2 [Cetraspora pellucida]|uniref:17399_t:CDS:1 n=1 Tax=Cetraspora pellucida TaxID=1433469 RepID=A0ACA9KCJ8_9GLOM|nr:17399_t:CDS:2 [Cetraspora pellucida]